MLARSIFALAIVMMLLTTTLADEKWAQFRGPGSMGVAEDANLPDTWSTTENVAWKTEIPGTGWSSPVVWGDNIFVTSVVSTVEGEKPKKGLYFGGERKAATDVHRWVVYCVDWKTGKIRWQREVLQSVPQSSRHLKNSYASETPVTDGERVYAYFGNVGLFCFDMNGKPLWSKKWGPFKTRYGWGTAASPVLYKDRIYVVNDNDEQSFMLALNKKTGEQVWRAEREEGTNWATPYIWENESQNRDHHARNQMGALLRFERQAAVAVHGHVFDQHTDAVFKIRDGLYSFRLRRRSGSARVCHSPRSVGRHHAQRRREDQQIHRVVSAASRALQPFTVDLWRLLLHVA